MALPFAPSLFYLFFALFGASIPDLDHNANTNKIYTMLVVGIILSVLLFFYNGVSLSGLILICLAIIFYFSKHRGFTHSFFGIVVLSALFLFMIMGFLPILARFGIPSTICLFIVMALVGYLIISRRVLSLYMIVLIIYLVLSPVNYLTLNWSIIFLMLFIGAFSHLVLDLLTPSGLSVFWPISDTKFHKSLGYILLLCWLLTSIFFVCKFGIISPNLSSIFK